MNGARALTVLLGSIVLAAGLLIALLSGGCTLIFGWYIFESSAKGPGGVGSALSGVVMSLGIGGVAFAIGAVAAWAGWRMIRGPKAAPAEPETFD